KRAAWLPEFRKHYNTYYEDGETKGINFSLSVAIELARVMLATAHDSAERGTAALLLGNALRALGERESGTARLEEAVAAYRAALGADRCLPIGARGTGPRSGAARVGDDGDHPRHRAFETRGTGERDGAFEGGGCGLPRGA